MEPDTDFFPPWVYAATPNLSHDEVLPPPPPHLASSFFPQWKLFPTSVQTHLMSTTRQNSFRITASLPVPRKFRIPLPFLLSLDSALLRVCCYCVKKLREMCFSVPDTSHVPFFCLCSVQFILGFTFFFPIVKMCKPFTWFKSQTEWKVMCRRVLLQLLAPPSFPLLLVRFMHLRFLFANAGIHLRV